MHRRPGLVSLALLLAMVFSPVAGTARPAASLRLVVGIVWLSDDADDQAESASQSTGRRVVIANAPVAIGCEPDSRPRATAFQRSRFQRPPPAAAL